MSKIYIPTKFSDTQPEDKKKIYFAKTQDGGHYVTMKWDRFFGEAAADSDWLVIGGAISSNYAACFPDLIWLRPVNLEEIIDGIISEALQDASAEADKMIQGQRTAEEVRLRIFKLVILNALEEISKGNNP